MASSSVVSLSHSASASQLLSDPQQQLVVLAQNPKNFLFAEAVKRIGDYVETGKKLNGAVSAAFSYFDRAFLYTLTGRIALPEQEQFKKDIRLLLQRIFHVQHRTNLGRYDVAEIHVRDSLNTLGEGMRAKILATYGDKLEDELEQVGPSPPSRTEQSDESHPFGVTDENWTNIGPS